MAQGVDTSNLEAAQKKYDELKQPYDKLVEQRDAIRDELAPLWGRNGDTQGLRECP